MQDKNEKLKTDLSTYTSNKEEEEYKTFLILINFRIDPKISEPMLFYENT